jgi:hypothetical protein
MYLITMRIWYVRDLEHRRMRPTKNVSSGGIRSGALEVVYIYVAHTPFGVRSVAEILVPAVALDAELGTWCFASRG